MGRASGPGYTKHPQHNIGITPVEGTLEVWAQDRLIAHSNRWLALQESRYPLVHYVPTADVQMEWLQASATDTYCPFKGHARYWSLLANESHAKVDDILWSYPDPYLEVEALLDHVAFYPDRVQRIVANVQSND